MTTQEAVIREQLIQGLGSLVGRPYGVVEINDFLATQLRTEDRFALRKVRNRFGEHGFDVYVVGDSRVEDEKEVGYGHLTLRLVEKLDVLVDFVTESGLQKIMKRVEDAMFNFEVFDNATKRNDIEIATQNNNSREQWYKLDNSTVRIVYDTVFRKLATAYGSTGGK